MTLRSLGSSESFEEPSGAVRPVYERLKASPHAPNDDEKHLPRSP